jgi:hypothetical protein
MITFTVPETGVMKPLVKTEPKTPADVKTALPGAHGAIRRAPLPADLVVGVALDAERLYVLTAARVFQMATPTTPGGGERGRASRGRAPVDEPTEPTLLGHQFKLHAYSLKDGAALLGDGYELPLVNEDPKATEPPDTKKVTETLGRGPIELVTGGVKSRGTTIIFTGNDVKSVDVQGKQFTPPPGFFVRDPSARIG